ncbi:MAG: S-layer homology domain-containing protein, partial [Acidaminobacteraceae bacterium]
LALALVLGITSTTLVTFASPSSWAKDDYFLLNYEELLSDELIKQSKLSQNINREEFAELAIRLYSKASRQDFNLMSKKNPFLDTNNEYISMAYNVGLINGTSQTTFSPTENLTREQLAMIIYNELRILGVNTSFDSNVSIVDKSSISTWALDAVKFCVDSGILTGDDNAYIKPQDRATREQAIAIVSRVAKKYSWIEEVEVMSASSYKDVNGFSAPIASKTDLLIYKPDNSTVALRIYHNGIENLNTVFNFKKLDKQILDILDKNNLYNYETSFMVSEYVKDNWDNTNKTFVFESTKYFKNGSMLSLKPSGSYVQVKSGSYLEINIYK